MSENLVKFRALCRKLLAEGIKPTPSEFAKRGWPYVQLSGPYRSYARAGHPQTTTPGSGTTWIAGKYTQARREELLRAGWTFRKFTPDKESGVWEPPQS